METKQVVQGAATGAVCGLLASAAMNTVPAIWSAFSTPEPPRKGAEDATVKTAERLAEPVLDRPLTPGEKETGGPAVHFAFGTLVGAVYGALATVLPPVTAGLGIAYGTAVWLLGDEVLVPKLGLAAPPSQTKPEVHFKSWLMHAVYGLALDTGRRLAEKRLG